MHLIMFGMNWFQMGKAADEHDAIHHNIPGASWGESTSWSLHVLVNELLLWH